MQDISSDSKKFKFRFRFSIVNLYGGLIHKNLSGIIKAISYIIAVLTIIVGIGIALLIAKKQIVYIALSFGVVLLFTIFAAIEFFLIYGLGHIIAQNNEILKRM